jgi:hypothetical protein
MSTECTEIDLQALVQQALDLVVSGQLTEAEAAKVRLCLAHPSEQLEAEFEMWCEALDELLTSATVTLLNNILYPTD